MKLLGMSCALILLVACTAFAQPGLQNHAKQIIKAWNLDEAQILDSQMRRGVIRHTVLSDTKFESVDLDNALFDQGDSSGVTLRNLKWHEPSLLRCEFDGVKLENTLWRNARADHFDLKDCKFERGEIDGLRLLYYDIRDFRAESLEIRDPVCENVTLRDGRFSRGSLRGTRFDGTDFSNVVLEDCDIRGLKINGVDIEELLKHR
jgi:uncharacterized protein YjbI with pentapeptide repeats